jgi:hypothetical protein
MAGWSKNTQVELRALLRALGQPTDGGKAALVQRLTAFLADGGSEATGDEEGCGGPSASVVTELEAAGADRELSVWREAVGRLDKARTSLVQAQATETQARTAAAQARAERAQQKAAAEAAATAAHVVLQTHRTRHNEQTCQLLQLVGHGDLSRTFMQAQVWGVVGLWRLRGVCRTFRRWAQAELSSLPRVVAVGGIEGIINRLKWVATASVDSLDLSTMRWSSAGCMPSLPDPRAWHSVSCCADGRVVVCGGYNLSDDSLSADNDDDQMVHLGSTALQWLPGTGAWSALPGLPSGRVGAASVGLLDGRTMLIGGLHEGSVASVLVLAANGSGWSKLPPLTGPRAGPVAVLLPDGKVFVAGGKSDGATDTALKTAELWDPATQVWTALPPMAHARASAAASVLPSGRVVVLGGRDTDGTTRKDGEVFDPVKREWEPLGAEMAHRHGNISTLAVAGAVLAVGGAEDKIKPELYDEESRRWFRLPHAMAKPRDGVRRSSAGLVSVPATALQLTLSI